MIGIHVMLCSSTSSVKSSNTALSRSNTPNCSAQHKMSLVPRAAAHVMREEGEGCEAKDVAIGINSANACDTCTEVTMHETPTLDDNVYEALQQ